MFFPLKFNMSQASVKSVIASLVVSLKPLAASFIASSLPQKALKDTIIRVKKNSLDYKAKSKDANDIMNIQRIIEGKKMLEKLEKLNISLN